MDLEPDTNDNEYDEHDYEDEYEEHEYEDEYEDEEVVLEEVEDCCTKDKNKNNKYINAEMDVVALPVDYASEAADLDANRTRIWLNEQLQSSIFYVEPVSHVTFQLLHVDEVRGTLTHAETFIARLTEPNIVRQLDIARVIKRARLSADGRRLEYRLKSLFVYNAHVELHQLAKYIRNPAAFNFVTALTSINSFAFKPTLACFHSLNSIHVVLSPVRAAPAIIIQPDPPAAAASTPETGTAAARTSTSTRTSTRTVRITQDAISGSSRHSRKRKRIIYHRH